jgi:hypothetical protein
MAGPLPGTKSSGLRFVVAAGSRRQAIRAVPRSHHIKAQERRGWRDESGTKAQSRARREPPPHAGRPGSFRIPVQRHFQELFDELSAPLRRLFALGLTLLVLAIAMLIAPSMRHRIVEDGQDSRRLLATATLLTSSALLPFSIALALDIAIVLDSAVGSVWGVSTGAAFFFAAIFSLYGLEFLLLNRKPHMQEIPKPTPLATKVEQLLTEARVIIPGAQALLGLQRTVVFTRAFQQLSAAPKNGSSDCALLHRRRRSVADGARVAASHFFRRRGQPPILEDRIGICCFSAAAARDRDRPGNLCGGTARVPVGGERDCARPAGDARALGLLVRLSDRAAPDPFAATGGSRPNSGLKLGSTSQRKYFMYVL